MYLLQHLLFGFMQLVAQDVSQSINLVAATTLGIVVLTEFGL
ncbi:hypothetical protein [uncultured Polaribacter sp.]|nr:hypothetical protein [uncultured Polaribacter sp.]